MARIRSIKPEFWDDPELASLTRDQRLLYIGLWNLCYDNWTMEYDPRRVAKALFGWDADATPEAVDNWVRGLGPERVVFFEHDGHTCIYLPKCAKHQRVSRPSSSPIPPPDSVSTHGGLTEDSRTELVLGAGIKEREKGKGGAREDAPPEEPRDGGMSLPSCMSAEIHVVDPERFDGTCAEFVWAAIQQQFMLLSDADRNTIATAVTEGCLPFCKGDLAQGCALQIAYKLRTKAGPDLKRSRLWLTTLRDDRHEVRREAR